MGSSGSIPPDFIVVYASKGKNRGGRPKKIIIEEELLKYRKYPLKEAANRLNASESTVKRRCKDHGYDSWAEVRQSAISMPVEDGVIVKMHHKGRIIAFLLPAKATVQQLHYFIEDNLLLPDGTTYDVKYIAEDLEFSIVGQRGLDVCLSLASKSPELPYKSIDIVVEDVVN